MQNLEENGFRAHMIQHTHYRDGDMGDRGLAVGIGREARKMVIQIS